MVMHTRYKLQMRHRIIKTAPHAACDACSAGEHHVVHNARSRPRYARMSSTFGIAHESFDQRSAWEYHGRASAILTGSASQDGDGYKLTLSPCEPILFDLKKEKANKRSRPAP